MKLKYFNPKYFENTNIVEETTVDTEQVVKDDNKRIMAKANARTDSKFERVLAEAQENIEVGIVQTTRKPRRTRGTKQ